MAISSTEAPPWSIRGARIEFPRPVAVGIVNVTDDSFYSGARSGTPKQAVEDGLRLAAAGFEMLDVGAVPARSGPHVPVEEEADQLVPAVEGLVERGDLPVSVDTFSPEVARRAVEAGAAAVNDTSGGADPAMFELAAETGCGLVIMHIAGPPRADREPPAYDDVIEELKRFFGERIDAALERGVAPEQIALDPGFDFDLGVEDGVAVLRRLDELRTLGRPLFVALSRKDLLGALLAGSWDGRPAPEAREWATAAAVALAVEAGAEMLRLHDESALQAMRVAAEIARA